MYQIGYNHTLEKLGLSQEMLRAATNKHLLRALWRSIRKNPLQPTKHLTPELDRLIKRFPLTLRRGVV